MAQTFDKGQNAGIISQIDPRFRILAAFGFALVTVLCRDLSALLLALACAVGVMVLARLPILPTLRRMIGMDMFVVLMLVMLPFTMPGTPIFEIGGFTASRQGLIRALEIGLKANAVILMLLALVGSMSSVMLGHALYRLKVPGNLVHLLLFTVRYIDVLHQEYMRLRIAMMARGFRPRTTLHTMQTYAYLIGMMLVRAIERSERILAAMTCRGFVGQFPLFDDFRITMRDYVFGCSIVLVCAAVAFVEIL